MDREYEFNLKWRSTGSMYLFSMYRRPFRYMRVFYLIGLPLLMVISRFGTATYFGTAYLYQVTPHPLSASLSLSCDLLIVFFLTLASRWLALRSCSCTFWLPLSHGRISTRSITRWI
jgi:hypothetical protein